MERASTASTERPAAPDGGGAAGRGFANLWGAANERLRCVVVAALLATGIYLAAALPITGSEAYAFGHFVRPPVRDWLGGFDPANRVLNSLLMKRAVGILRLSAFSLRAPGWRVWHCTCGRWRGWRADGGWPSHSRGLRTWHWNTARPVRRWDWRWRCGCVRSSGRLPISKGIRRVGRQT